MSLPVHTFGKMPLDHSFLSKGIEFSVFFKSFFFHSSLLYQSMLLGGGGCWMSKCSFIILHCSVSHTDRTNTLPLLTPLGGDCFLYIYIKYVHTFLSRISSIILHCSLNPCFWGGACSMPNFSFIIRHCSVMPYC